MKITPPQLSGTYVCTDVRDNFVSMYVSLGRKETWKV